VLDFGAQPVLFYYYDYYYYYLLFSSKDYIQDVPFRTITAVAFMSFCDVRIAGQTRFFSVYFI
jgi:hypothetical protein